MLQNYLVAGLGVTGLSVVAYLVKQNLPVIVTDTRAEPPHLEELKAQFPNVPVLLGSLTIPEEITHIVLSPGLALNTPEIVSAAARGIEIIGDIELFARAVDKPVLAITGSNGKSTTTTLLGVMAQACGKNPGVGGNLGTAALDLLNAGYDCYILELSSFQLETTHSLALQAATVLNISPDHMDRYADVAEYNNAKLRIYKHAHVAIVNRQDPLTFVPAEMLVEKVISFGLDQPSADNYGLVQKDSKTWIARGAQLLLPINEMALMGAHNVANALAALAMGEVAGFDLEIMLQTLRTFSGLPHRCEKVIVANGVVWINDSKGTNVGATLAAIEGLADAIPGQWVIILGGVGKNADFEPLIAPLAKCCKAAILIGEDAPKLWDLLHNIVPCEFAKDLREVVQIAHTRVQAGDGVLLSPACASLDMFKNYMHRGEVFRTHVLQEIGSSTAYAKASTN